RGSWRSAGLMTVNITRRTGTRTRQRPSSARRQHETVPVGIFEDRRCAPVGLLRRSGERDPLGGQLVVRLLDVVEEEGDRRELSNLRAAVVGGEEHQM